MIISRTPFRVSFFGGGTDYPAWYEKEKGAVLSTTIDKHCYLTCRWLPPFFPHRHRIAYSQIETVHDLDEIQHAAAREVLRHFDIDRGIEINYNGDLPARAGLGTSSSFVVGLLHAMHALQGEMVPAMQLAREAIHVEQRLLGEAVGSQDQVAAALGGLSRIEFSPGDEIQAQRLTLPDARVSALEEHLMLFFTGFVRTASEIASEQIAKTSSNHRELLAMRAMVDDGVEILAGEGDIRPFGELLHSAWETKRGLTDKITRPDLDEMYTRAREAGAIGGKLLGAGGGGFFLFFVEPERRDAVRAALSGALEVPFRFESQGSQIVFYDPEPDPGARP